MKKKFGVVLASFLSALLCIGGAGCLNTAQANAASDPTANQKSKVFTSPNGSITSMVEAFPFQDTFNPTTSVGASTNGIAILTESGSGMFEYTVPIKMSSMKSTDKLIEFYPLVGDDYALMTDVTITLTDTSDAKNTVAMYIYKHTNGAIYARCNYAGKSLALSSEGNSAGRLFDNNYGTYAATYSFAESKGAKNRIPMAISLDYAEREVYLSCHRGNWLVLDLDEISHVGKNSLWEGFENDEAKLSVTMNFATAKTGGCIVKSVIGTNLEGTFATAEDYSAPNVTYLCDNDYVEDMPVAGVNVPYEVPGVYAFDWFFGATPASNIGVKAYKLNGSGQYVEFSDDLSDGYLTPDTVGKYELRYTVKNEFRTTTSSLFVTAVEKLAPIIAVQVEEYETPVILQSLYIPEVNVFGGSGKLTKTEKLFYNGLEVPLHQTRKITVDKAGVISLRVECKAYTGETLVEYFPIEIPETTVLAVQEVPMILQTGVASVFPEAVAYDSIDGTPATVKIFVDGVETGADRKVIATKESGTVEVKYVATTARHGSTERIFNIPVISKKAADIKPSDYMLTQSGEVELTNTTAGLQMFTQVNNTQSYWAYPLVTGASTANASIALSLLKKDYDDGTSAPADNFEYVDVVYTDYEDTTKEMFVRIYRVCELNEKMSYLQINGVGTKYLIDGALSDSVQNVRFYINTATGQLVNAVTLVPIANLPADFTASISKVSIRFGGVTGDAGIVLKEIGNQSLGAREGKEWKDAIPPIVSMSRPLQSFAFISVNSTLIIPAMTAYDLRSTGSKVTVTVKFGDEILMMSENPTEETFFLADRVGSYTIMVTPTDAKGASMPIIYLYKTVDETAPVLTVEKTIIGELDNGTTIVIPNATATDNVDGANCKVLVQLIKLESGKVYEVKMGDEFQFTVTGNYKLRYYVFDSDYNHTEYVMNIKVK